jgi:nucleoside-diphosphate-sugar epimerase
MARRAFHQGRNQRRVIAVSRFSDEREAAQLQSDGIDVLRGDLLDHDFVRSLPRVANVLYLVGMKFGGAGALADTWMTNTYIAGAAADHFRDSRIVALSTGNVYALVPAEPGTGANEGDEPCPQGEYAMSALGRERVFQSFSQHHGTPLAIIRLNYATEFRYGVLVDLAKQVYAGEPISLEMGYFNVIWQRDACDMILRCFSIAATPPRIMNVTGAERLSCRGTCQELGKILEREVRFMGEESPTALLSDASLAVQLFGRPATSIVEMLAMTADWIRRCGETWNKPTKFQVRNGRF